MAVQRLAGLETVPPGIDSVTNVQSKDVVISEDEAISARIFLPKITNPHLKLPVLVYFQAVNEHMVRCHSSS
ncbi:hypothetical protein K1719_033480 [Acacia pycnantha]|nr:hypothetical protein K1719_033480 [Acacia pycnantha]